jgi:hypothetical protein
VANFSATFGRHLKAEQVIEIIWVREKELRPLYTRPLYTFLYTFIPDLRTELKE